MTRLTVKERAIVAQAACLHRNGERVRFNSHSAGLRGKTMTVVTSAGEVEIATVPNREYEEFRAAVRREFFAPVGTGAVFS